MYLGNLHKKDQTHFATTEVRLSVTAGSNFSDFGLQTDGFRDFRGGKHQRWRICGTGSGVWDGVHGQDHGGDVSGGNQSSASEEVHDSNCDTSVEGVRELGVGHGEVRGNGGIRDQQGSEQTSDDRPGG